MNTHVATSVAEHAVDCALEKLAAVSTKLVNCFLFPAALSSYMCVVCLCCVCVCMRACGCALTTGAVAKI